jgi:hypothetical protein
VRREDVERYSFAAVVLALLLAIWVKADEASNALERVEKFDRLITAVTDVKGHVTNVETTFLPTDKTYDLFIDRHFQRVDSVESRK